MVSLIDELIFATEAVDEKRPQADDSSPWRVLVVDDDPDVFRVTELSLRYLRFRDRPVQLLTASSGGAARAHLENERDIALALIDVVMETETAGLDLIRTIRAELGITDMRIILRTGQPGQAPERDVILNYEIDGYADKAEMTSMKLFTTVVAALRAYETMSNLSRLTAELEKRVAARTADLEKLAMIDALTGVANRRHFEIRAAVEIAEARRSGCALGSFMMDIDHFKHINDRHGHATGDAVLQQFVDVVMVHLRPCDLFARIGGEEFVVLLPGSDHEESLAVAERVREAVAAAQIGVGGTCIPVTVSLGISALTDEDEDIGSVVSRADHALYRAKAAGRNRALLSQGTDRTLETQPQQVPSRAASVRFGDLFLDLDARRLLQANGMELQITPMEFDLLAAFARNPNRVLSSEDLIDLAHSQDSEPFDSSIDVCIARVRCKVERDPERPQVIKTIPGAGYTFVPSKP